MSIYSLLADAVVILHAAYVSFVLLGLVAILVGIPLRWKWTRNFWFRAIHLVMITVVVFEALLGITCPLTTWEYELRVAAGEDAESESFMGRLMHDLIFYDAPQWVFTVGYCVFGACVLATFIFAPPRRPWKQRTGMETSES